MKEVLVGEHEKREIRAQVDRILRDLGRPEPPLQLADVRSLLSLDLQYYSSADPGLITELTHRVKLLARKTLPDLGKHLVEALAKSRLCAFWVPESSRILLDSTVPERKHRWIEAHEITHSVTPWHKHYLLGDNSQTLDPECHATLESEANYGAGRLLFLQDQFSHDAQDLPPTFASIKQLSKRYGNSIASTFWRMVEERNPGQSMFGMVSIHPRHPTVGQHAGPHPWRYFIRSNAFSLEFAGVLPEVAFDLATKNATYRKTGPVCTDDVTLCDMNGMAWEFSVESFSTGHALLTLGIKIRPRVTAVVSASLVGNSHG